MPLNLRDRHSEIDDDVFPSIKAAYHENLRRPMSEATGLTVIDALAQTFCLLERIEGLIGRLMWIMVGVGVGVILAVLR